MKFQQTQAQHQTIAALAPRFNVINSIYSPSHSSKILRLRRSNDMAVTCTVTDTDLYLDMRVTARGAIHLIKLYTPWGLFLDPRRVAGNLFLMTSKPIYYNRKRISHSVLTH